MLPGFGVPFAHIATNGTSPAARVRAWSWGLRGSSEAGFLDKEERLCYPG